MTGIARVGWQDWKSDPNYCKDTNSLFSALTGGKLDMMTVHTARRPAFGAAARKRSAAYDEDTK